MLQSPPIRRALSQGSRCNILRGCGFCEEVRILSLELIFAFPCELRTSLGVPSNFDDGRMTLHFAFLISSSKISLVLPQNGVYHLCVFHLNGTAIG
ncbi:hypothetical protein Tco_0144006 [Tanacetum coccineum]